jgi:hypothetical protein
MDPARRVPGLLFAGKGLRISARPRQFAEKNWWRCSAALASIQQTY